MMNNPLTDPNNSPRMKLGILLLGIGLLILGCNFAIMSRYIFLDVFGTKTNGELVVHRYSCEGSKGGRSTCYEAQIEFKNTKDKEYAVGVGIIPVFYDLIVGWRNPERTHYYDVTIRYFSLFPYLAKVNLPYFIEYLSFFNIAALAPLLLGIDFIRIERRYKRSAQPPGSMDNNSKPGVFS